MSNSDFDCPYPLAEYRAKMVSWKRIRELVDRCERQNLDLLTAKSDERTAWGLATDGHAQQYFILADRLRPASKQEALKSVPNPISSFKVG